MASMLPKLIVIKASCCDYAYYKGEDGSILLQEKDVFSTLVKIEVERAKTSDKYVHLRFSYSNRYWAKSASNTYIVAESKQPEEDTTKASCTLFEPVQLGQSGGEMFGLKHVQSGGGVLIDTKTWMLYVDNRSSYDGLSFVDWGTLVKLPPHCAFKGDNGNYLKAYQCNGGSHLQFGSDDANDVLSGHQVSLMPDGHVRLFSDHFGKFWWMAQDWIYGDWDKVNETTRLFWPVKIDENTIALRSKANNNFCKRLTRDGVEDCLAAVSSTITREARLRVEELVLQRKIYYVRYRMEDSRIFGETPYLAGTARLTNTTDQEDSMSVSITYQDEKSYTFSRGVSITAGVKATIEAGVPFIAEGKIEVSFEITGSFQWDTTTTTTTPVTATGTVPIPARSMAVVDYVGTRGTCNIPYSYTQEDQSSTSGLPARFQQIDGIYNGVSYYNFDFRVREGSIQSI